MVVRPLSTLAGSATMNQSQLTTDKREVERWADEHDAVPVREGGSLHLIPEDKVTADQERIDWDTFHREVDDQNQVVVLHGDSGEERSFEVTDRSSAIERVTLDEGHDPDDIENRLLEGETITGTITETTVVTETIVEEATLESEVVDRDIVDRRVTDVELLDRTIRNCEVTGNVGNIDYANWTDTDRFLVDDADVTTGERERYEEYPFDVTVEISEDLMVTIEEQERFTVETRITDVDVTETDTLDSQDLEARIDIDAVHDHLVETIGVDADRESEIIDTETYDIESEFTEDDAITTNLTSWRTVEKEISEQWELTGEIVEGEMRSRETRSETVRESGLVERGTSTGETMATEGEQEYAEGEDLRVVPSDDDVGKPVVAPTGDQIGMVTDVEGNVAYVDPHPGMTEKIMAKLGWGGADEEDFPLEQDRIERITDDEVRLSGDYDEDELEHIEQPD